MGGPQVQPAPRQLAPRATRVTSGFGPPGLTIECGCRNGLDEHGLASPFAESHRSLYQDQHHARWQLRAAFASVLEDDAVPEVAAYEHMVITTAAYVTYSRRVPDASAGFGARVRDSLASYVVHMWERKLNVYLSCQDCLDRYPCHVDYMVDYINAQYSLLESGQVQSLETYQAAMDRSAVAAIRDECYQVLGDRSIYAERPPPLDLPAGFTQLSDGNVVAPDGVVMGSEEDWASQPVFQPDEPVVMHPDFVAVLGPVVHGPDPRMAAHLMP